MCDLQLVIFDCDGVLVDSETISNRVLARALTAEGLPTTLAQSRRDYQGLLLAEINSRAQAKLGRPLAKDWLERYERDRRTPFGEDLARARLRRGELEPDDPRPAGVFQAFFEDEDGDNRKRDHRDAEQDQPLLAGQTENTPLGFRRSRRTWRIVGCDTMPGSAVELARRIHERSPPDAASAAPPRMTRPVIGA